MEVGACAWMAHGYLRGVRAEDIGVDTADTRRGSNIGALGFVARWVGLDGQGWRGELGSGCLNWGWELLVG